MGGGEVAARKAQSLLDAGARVTVIAPVVVPQLENVDGIAIFSRSYKSGDVIGFALVFAATDDRSINAIVFDEASKQNIPVNVVDDPELCSFIVPSVIRRGDLMIAISSSGKSPSLCKKIRKELEEQYGEEYADFVDLLGELRPVVKAKYLSQSDREAVFAKLLNVGILELLCEGKKEEARKRALECI